MIISFLASHGGSAARAIITAIRTAELAADVGIVITNNRDSTIYQWCLDNGVPVQHISSQTEPDEAAVDEAIATLLSDQGSDLVACSGYMKKIGPKTLARFSGRLLNVHPALLPKHGGKGFHGDRVHAEVLRSGDKESGATIHLVTDEYDQGPIIAQCRVPVLAEDSVESLRQRVQAEEPALYLRALQQFIQPAEQKKGA